MLRIKELITLQLNDKQSEKIEEELNILSKKSNYDFKGYLYSQNLDNTLLIETYDLIWKLSNNDLSKGDIVFIRNKNKELIYENVSIISREIIPVKGTQFHNLELNWCGNEEIAVKINCHIEYTKEEMDWIKIGVQPLEMEDRIIMFVENNEISIFGSWGGYGLYKATFKEINKKYLIYQLTARKRNVEIDTTQLKEKFKQIMHFHLETRDYLTQSQLAFKQR